jgi:hypothetical protein
MIIWILPVILLALCGALWLFGKIEDEQVTDKMIQEALDLWSR